MSKFILILIFISYATVTFAQSTSTKVWTLDEMPLTWNDFSPKAKMPDIRTASLSVNTKYGWESNESDTAIIIQLTATINILKDKSIVKQSFLKEADEQRKISLLKHEKGHLAVAFIKQFWLQDTLQKITLKYANYKDQLRDVYNAIELKADSLNKAYDKATLHSEEKAMQLLWEKDLMIMLNAFKKDETIFPFEIKQHFNLSKLSN